MSKSRAALNELVQIRVDEVQSNNASPTANGIVEAIYSVIESELDDAAFDVIKYSTRENLFPLIESDKKFHHGEGVEDVDVRVIINKDYSGKIVMPADFYKLISVKMTSWKREVTELHQIGSDIWKWQKNNHAQGSYDNPVGIYTPFTQDQYVSNEQNPYDIDHTYTVEVTIEDMYNGQNVASNSLSTNDIVVCTAQTVEAQNGVYIIRASGLPTRLGDVGSVTPDLPQVCVEFFKSKTEADTLESLYYISKRKAERMPDELIDAMIWYCAGRVFKIGRQFDLAKIAIDTANQLLNVQSRGVVGE